MLHRTPELLCLAALTACASAPAPDSSLRVDIVRTEAVEQLDSLPAPTLSVSGRRLEVHAYIGLGATGYELVPQGTVDHEVIELLVTPRMPEEMAGLTVLTRYEYRLTTALLEPGSYAVRLRHGRDGGEPVLVFEGRITVE